jgi:hypothetical protein
MRQSGGLHDFGEADAVEPPLAEQHSRRFEDAVTATNGTKAQVASVPINTSCATSPE